MTPAELEAIERRAEAATPTSDAELMDKLAIYSFRSDVPRLVERVRQLEAALADMIAATREQNFPADDEDFERLNKACVTLYGKKD